MVLQPVGDLPRGVKSSVVEVLGLPTHFLEAGPAVVESSRTVLLLHDGAFGADATSMLPLIDELAQQYRLVVPDLLGYGRTAKVVGFGGSSYDLRTQHLAHFCAQLGLRDLHAVGASYTGSLLLHACADGGPHLPLASVTSIAGTGGPWRRPSTLGEYDGSRTGMRTLSRYFVDPDWPGFETLVERRHHASLIPGHVEALRAARTPGLASPGPRRDWPGALARSAVPIMLIHTADDELLESDWTAHFEGVVPRLTISTVPGRHLPHLDHAPKVAARVREFIESVENDPPGTGSRLEGRA